MVDTYDLRLTLQSITLAVMIFSALAVAWFRIKYKYIPRSFWGICALIIHVILFYTLVILSEVGVFNVIEFAKETFNCQVLTFGTWSSAIRLQTAIEIFLMIGTVVRRQSWINSALR